MSKEELMLIGGSAHPELNRQVADVLGVDLVPIEIGRHVDSEDYVKVFANLRDREVYVLQPTGRSIGRVAAENAFEAAALLATCKQAGAKRTTLVAPYFAFARSDRRDDTGEYRNPVMAKLVTELFEQAGADQLLAFDLHADQIPGFADGMFENVHARKVFTRYLKARDVVESPVIAAPDTGAAKIADKFAESYGTGDIAIIHKNRLSDTHTKVAAVIGEVAGRDVVLVDDIVSTAGSLVNAAEALKDKGARKVIAAVTHGVLCDDALETINSSDALTKLYVSDSLPTMGESSKIIRVSIVPLLAKVIRNMYTGGSVKRLSDHWEPARG